MASRVALVDPLVTLSLAPALTATTAIEARTPAVAGATLMVSAPRAAAGPP